ncbi:MAG: hypothetical protein M3Y17_12645 [Actinomycetota bacterium]|nr:hypothetical protein [Actinomycetota bacterium]
MDFDKLARKAQEVYTQRGGAQAAREDATEVEQILEGEGTLMDKAKRAAKALKEPGAAHDPGAAQDPSAPRPASPRGDEAP